MSDSKKILIIGHIGCDGLLATQEMIRKLTEQHGPEVVIMTDIEAAKNGFGEELQKHLGSKEPFFIEQKPFVLKAMDHQKLVDPIIFQNNNNVFPGSKRGRKKGRNKRW